MGVKAEEGGRQELEMHVIIGLTNQTHVQTHIGKRESSALPAFGRCDFPEHSFLLACLHSFLQKAGLQDTISANSLGFQVTKIPVLVHS